MSSGNEVDIHEELAGAAVTPLHKALGVLITLITMFDGYDTFNPAYVIHYVMQPGACSRARRGFWCPPAWSASCSARWATAWSPIVTGGETRCSPACGSSTS